MGLLRFLGYVLLTGATPLLGWAITTTIRPGQWPRRPMVALAALFTTVAVGCGVAAFWISSRPSDEAGLGAALLPIGYLAAFGLWLSHNARRIKVYVLMAKTFPGPDVPVVCAVSWVEDLMHDITRAWSPDVLTVARHELLFKVRLVIATRVVATIHLPHTADTFFRVLGEHHLHAEAWPLDDASIASVRLYWSRGTWVLETVRFPGKSGSP